MVNSKNKTSQKLPHLTLHYLLPALSYWGTTTRVLLISFIGIIVLFLGALETMATGTSTSWLRALTSEGQWFVYVVGSFLILDAGYVLLARGYVLSRVVDTVVLLSAEIILALSYFLPYFAVVSDKFASLTKMIFVAILAILAARLLFGVLYGIAAKR